MEGLDAVRLDQPELVAQQFAEEVVVAIPLAFGVERDEEEVRGLELPQKAPGVVPIGDGVAKWGAEAIEDGRLQQEGADLLGLAGQHFGAQVVNDVAVIAGEVLDERVGVGSPSQGERREIEPGHPPFRAISQPYDRLMVESQPVQVVEEEVSLLVREAQLLGIDLDQFAAGTQPGQREWRLGSARQDEREGLGKVLDQEGEALVDLGIGDQVVVVEHEDDLVGQRREFGAEHRENVGDDVDARGQQRGKGASAGRGVLCAQGFDDVCPEPHRIVVVAVEREPGEGPCLVVGRMPIGQQCRLAPAGRCADQR
jgi:hypothetical protein